MDTQNYKYNFEIISKELTYFERILLKLEQIRYIRHPDRFYTETAYQKKVDGKLSYYYLFNKIKSNNFNRGSGYLTHGLDFYKGSFHGQMIRALINFCNLDHSSLILDPFCGCGTTLIEAKLLGFNSIGIDINPIACLNSKVKTELLDVPLNNLLTNNKRFLNFAYFEQLFPIENFNSFLNSDIRELFYSFIFTRAIASENRLGINKKVGFERNFNKAIYTLKQFEKLKKEIEIQFGNVNVFFDDSISFLRKLKSNSIDAIITSPPYIDLIDYIEEDIYQINLLLRREKIQKLKKNSIGNPFKNKLFTLKLYWNKLNLIIKELYRVLKLDKNCILIISNYGNMVNQLTTLVKNHRFLIEKILPRKVHNIKRKNNTEYVLFLKK